MEKRYKQYLKNSEKIIARASETIIKEQKRRDIAKKLYHNWMTVNPDKISDEEFELRNNLNKPWHLDSSAYDNILSAISKIVHRKNFPQIEEYQVPLEVKNAPKIEKKYIEGYNLLIYFMKKLKKRGLNFKESSYFERSPCKEIMRDIKRERLERVIDSG